MKLHSTLRISLTLSAISLVGLATSLPATAAKLYSVTDLGTLGTNALGSNFSVASGINDLGQVVGSSSSNTDNLTHGFRTAPNSLINPETDDLGFLDNSDNARFSRFTRANGINNLGQVVGTSYFGAGRQGAFRTAPNSPIDPATTDNITGYGFGNSINESGQVAGTLGGAPIAFRTAPNSPIDSATDILGSLNENNGNLAFANGINNLGQVVGAAGTAASTVGPYPSTEFHAFRTAPNSPINPSTDDLGTLGGEPNSSGDASVANAINDKGQVVGNSQTVSGETHAFRTAPNSPINPSTDDLGTLGGGYSIAYAINNKGQVVGASDTTSGVRHAFVYYKHQMLDLNNLIPTDSNFVLTRANGINKKGQIVGSGSINGETHAFLLTPER